jgi:hypothetical protein
MTTSDDPGSPALPPEDHQFDFWVGTWDVTWGDDARGTNVVRKILDDRAILEEFDASPTAAFRGVSISSWDAVARRWRQTWADTEGHHWNFTGGMGSGRMILSTDDLENGRTVRKRMVFFDISPEALEWTWERSVDDGATWELLWAIHYRRR